MVCAPISLLPQLKAVEHVEAALEKAEVLAGSKFLKDLKKQDAGPARLVADEKVSTRQKLLALNHSLNCLVRFKLSDCMPLRSFRPAGPGETRHYVQKDGLKLSYLWNSSTKTSVWQSTLHDGFEKTLRLSTLQDEGDSTAAQMMANHGLSVFQHRDSMHKLHREEVLAAGDVPEISLCKKQVLLVLKFEKAPWKTSSFGRRLEEARMRVNEIPESHALIEFVAPGVLHDLGLDPGSSMRRVKEALVEAAQRKASTGPTGQDHKSGRWADFVDSFGKLRREWSCRLFFLLFALVLEGKNPFSALASSGGDEADAETSLAPQVLRVPWCC